MPPASYAALRATGRVKAAMVHNSYFDATSGRGFEPTDWQAVHCTFANTSSLRFGWGSWSFRGFKNARCQSMLSEPHFPRGVEIMHIERGYWHNVMAATNKNPCFTHSRIGQPRVPWPVLDDLLRGVDCPGDSGWAN